MAVPLRAVVFDVGGVLVTDAPDCAALGDLLGGVRDERVREAFWGRRNAYDAGASDADYWGAIAADLGAAMPSSATVEALTAEDAGRWSRIEPSAATLVEDLARAGQKLVVLSNAPHALAGQMRGLAWAECFDDFVFSCETGVLKPHSGAYAAALEALARLGVEPSEAVFFDDRAVNVEAAAEHGLAARLWRDAASARSQLHELGVSLAAKK